MDTIIHAGDIDNQSVVDQLKNLSSSLIVVRGNADKEWVEHIPQEAWLEILGNKLFVIHNKGRTSCDVGDADIIIYGHSHKYSLVEKDRQIWLNPGCCDKRKKFQMSSKDLQKMKDRSDEICHEHGLSICEKNKTFDGHERTGFTAWTKEKYHFLQDMMEGKSKKSYVYNTMEVVRDSMNRASSQEEFAKLLSVKGYSVDWQDKHKYLTFMDHDGNKVRDTNLNRTFNLGIGKEEQLVRFERNAASMERDKYSHDKCIGIASRIRITEYMDAKAVIDKELKVRDKKIKKIFPLLKEGKDAITSARRAIKKYEKELKECPKILFIKYHDLEEKIAHKEAYIEGTTKTWMSTLRRTALDH